VLHNAPSTFAAKVDAEGWLAAEKRKIDLGTWGAAPAVRSTTLADYAEQWMSQRTLRSRTQSLYSSLLRNHILPALGDRKLRSLTPAIVRQWHADLGNDYPTARAHAYSLLHAICGTAVQDELLDANPCRISGAMTAKRQREITTLPPNDLNAVADAMPPTLTASVLLLGWCGLRPGEVFELRRRDVRDGAVLAIRRQVTYRDGEFTVGPPKTQAGIRDVTIPPHVRQAVVDHLRQHVGRGSDALLFPDPETGGHMREWSYRRPFKPIMASLGYPSFRVYDLRHTGATFAAQSGATTKELMNRIGHTTPAMAMRYQHVADGRDAEIAERISRLAQS
jgi:integrase